MAMSITSNTEFAEPILPQITRDKSGDGFTWPMPENANMAELCCDRWAHNQPHRIALIEGRETASPRLWSYDDLFRASCRLAVYLTHKGYQKGDRIAIFLPQGPEVLITHFAAYRIGAIIVPLFILFGSDALAYRLADSGAKLIVTDTARQHKVASLHDKLPHLDHMLVCGDDNLGDDASMSTASFWTAIAGMDDKTIAAIAAPDEPAMMIYTSGTTGPPKGVLHAHRLLIGHLPNIEISHNGFPKTGDRSWTPADWAWIGGLMDMAMPSLYYGVPLVSLRMAKFEAGAAWQFVAEHAIRNMFLPPAALKQMRNYALSSRLPKGLSVRSIASGGEVLGDTLISWAKTALHVDINEIYGQTECNLVIASNRALEHLPVGAMGRAVPGHRLAIIDDNGDPLGPGELGEIGVSGPDPVMFLRYWNKPDLTQEKFKKGWLCTGDMGRCDAHGFFTFVGRDDDIITSSGYRIGPAEIENCLMQHQSVHQAGIIGLPDVMRTQIITACIVADKNADLAVLEESLKALVKERLSPHLVPRRFCWLPELPVTSTGKIMRESLRQTLS